jgi:hypothetical protein
LRSSGEGEIEVSAASAGEAEVKAGKRIFVGRVVLRSLAALAGSWCLSMVVRLRLRINVGEK